MNCPVCKNPMIVLEIEEVEIDYCTECGGIWLDAGELELLVGTADKARQLIASFTASNSSETPRKCPICLKKMEKVLVGKENNHRELIDRCPKEHGLWFDAGELQQILKMAHFDDEGHVRHILGALFCSEETP